MELLKKIYKRERVKLEAEFKEFVDLEIRLAEENIKTEIIELYKDKEKLNYILGKDKYSSVYKYVYKDETISEIAHTLEQDLNNLSNISPQIIHSKVSQEKKGKDYYRYVVQFVKVKLIEHLLQSKYKIFPGKNDNGEIIFKNL